MLSLIWTFLWTISLSLQWYVKCEHFPCICSDLSYVNIFLVYAVICHMWTYSLPLQWSVICEHFPCPVNLMFGQELIATENRPTPFETIWLLYTPFKFRQKLRQGKSKKEKRKVVIFLPGHVSLLVFHTREYPTLTMYALTVISGFFHSSIVCDYFPCLYIDLSYVIISLSLNCPVVCNYFPCLCIGQ